MTDQPLNLSLCMIVRDSTRTLRPALDSVRPWVDEMVVVDTGSVDDTPQIAQELGARLFHFPWCDDFSAARNESLRHARGKWLFWMDSDDTIDEASGRKLRALADKPVADNMLGYVVQVHCPGIPTAHGQNVNVVDHLKVFRNRPDLRFEGRIHEQIMPAIRRANGETGFTDIVVVHSGADISPAGQRRKQQRDLRLLELDLADRPNHTFVLFNLGMTWRVEKEYALAADYLERSLRAAQSLDSHVRKAYSLLAECYTQLGQLDRAQAVCQGGLRHFSDDPELLYRLGALVQHSGQLLEAEQLYRRLLESESPRHLTSIDRDLCTVQARQNLAMIYEQSERLDDALTLWRQITDSAPGHRPAWRAMTTLLLRQSRNAEVNELADQLLTIPGLEGEGMLAMARAAEFVRDIPRAREVLVKGRQVYPQDMALLHAWCEFAFNYEQPAEVEAALRELVERNPTDASAHHNLGTLYLHAQRYPEAIGCYEQSLQIRPDYPLTLVNLGLALEKSARLTDATRCWEQVVRLIPGTPIAQEAEGHLRRVR